MVGPSFTYIYVKLLGFAHHMIIQTATQTHVYSRGCITFYDTNVAE